MFIIFSFLGGGDDFIDGISGLPYRSTDGSNLISMFFGKATTHTFEVLGLLALLIYMFSKEKIEDDYINKLRLESYQLTAIIGLIISILLYAFSENLKLTLDYFITLFMFFYLLTFFIKKRIY